MTNRFFACFAVLFLLAVSPARAQTLINACGSHGPGLYVVGTNLTSGGTCLDLSGDVTLLLPPDKSITGTGNAGETWPGTYGITHGGGKLQVSGGGRITGFRFCVHTNGSNGLITGLDLTGCRYFPGWIEGTNNAFRQNWVADTAGVTDEAYAFGVQCGEGSGCKIEGNIFRNIYRQAAAPPSQVGEGLPINFAFGHSGGVARYNLAVNDESRPNTYCVFGGGSGGHTFENNVCLRFWRPVAFADVGSPVVRNNVVSIDKYIAGSGGVSFAGANNEGNVVIGPYVDALSDTQTAHEKNTVFSGPIAAAAPPPPPPPPSGECNLITGGTPDGDLNNLAVARDGELNQTAAQGTSGPGSSPGVVGWAGVTFSAAKTPTKIRARASIDQGLCSSTNVEYQLWKNTCSDVSNSANYIAAGSSATIADAAGHDHVKTFAGHTSQTWCMRLICTDTPSHHWLAEFELYEGNCQ